MTTPDLRSHALAAVRLGFPVFALHYIKKDGRCSCGDTLCPSPGKHPYRRLARRGFHDATTDAKTVDRIWRDAPPANIGLRTGPVVVIDIDPRHAGDESLRRLQLQHGALPLTWRCLTGGGGEHIYFRAPRDRVIRNSAGSMAPGIDVRGEGGYVLAAGSRHASGRTYEWSVDHHPDEIPLAEMPPWLLDLTGDLRKARRTPEQWQGIAAQSVPEGQRNSTAAALYGHLVRRDVDAKVALELLRTWNIARCNPPMADTEIVTIAMSISERELRRREESRGR